MISPRTRPDRATAELAGRLRLAVTRLQRQLRQQSTGDLTLTQLSALSTMERRGTITLGELATHERLAPPTVTKVVAKLEALGHVTRAVDDADRRVSNVGVTASGRRHLDDVRTRRNAWLTNRLSDLSAPDRARLVAAIDVLERLSSDDAATEGVSS